MAETGTPAFLDTRHWKQAVTAHVDTPLALRIAKLLGAFKARSSYPGDVVTIDARHDYPLVDAIRSDELYFLLEQLRDKGDIQWPLLEEPDGRVRQIPEVRQPVTRGRLTLQGWERASEPSLSTSAAATGEHHMAKQFGVFVCHASEDKGDIAQPAAEELRRRGYQVWYDEFVLRLGEPP